MDESSRKLDDPENARFLGDAALVACVAETIPLGKIDAARYALVHFAGGHGVMWDFPKDAEVQRVAAAIYEGGGIVAAVCHGPAALINVRLKDGSYLVANKDISTFTNAEKRRWVSRRSSRSRCNPRSKRAAPACTRRPTGKARCRSRGA